MSRVLVIGGGIAGCSAATFLAASGVEVVVYERRRKRNDPGEPKYGESLPPDSQTLLMELGVWEEFQLAGHLPCYFNKSYWGNDEVTHRDFLNHPLGHGWHLDRVAFEQMMLDRCCAVGAKIVNHVPEKIERSASGWLVDGEEIDFIIDASGRSSWFAKRQGVERLVDEKLLGLIAFLQSERELDDSSSLTESVGSDWWYSAAIPGKRMATVFVGRPDPEQGKKWRSEQGWWDLLEQAPHTQKRIQDGGFALMQQPKLVSIESSILKSLVGDAWLAVGDAALSYDPIASHGIMMAMVSARDAAAAVKASLAGNQSPLLDYDERLGEAFYHYVRQRHALYDQLESQIIAL